MHRKFRRIYFRQDPVTDFSSEWISTSSFLRRWGRGTGVEKQPCGTMSNNHASWLKNNFAEYLNNNVAEWLKNNFAE